MNTATATATVTSNGFATTSTDIATIAKTALATLAKSATKGGLDDLLMGARRSLMLVDCSGSMNERIVSGGRKIDALRNVVAEIKRANNVPVAAFGAYGAAVQVVETVPEPSGMTPLHTAIDFGRAEGATHLVVITDGIPDSESAAFASAIAFANPIDVFYIGDGNDSGAQFSKALAKMTGGTCNLTDLGKPKELAAKIVLMIGDGN